MVRQRSVAGLLPWRPVFDPRSVQVRFVVNKVALGHRVSSFTWCFPVGIIPPVRHIPCLNITGVGVGRVSSVDIATRYGLDGPVSNPGGDEIFRTCPDRP